MKLVNKKNVKVLIAEFSLNDYDTKIYYLQAYKYSKNQLTKTF